MALDARPNRLALAGARLAPLWLALLVIGGYSAAFGWRPWGGIVMLAGFFGQLGWHVLVGFSEYRRIMSRPWPKVEPLEDDDDWGV